MKFIRKGNSFFNLKETKMLTVGVVERYTVKEGNHAKVMLLTDYFELGVKKLPFTPDNKKEVLAKAEFIKDNIAEKVQDFIEDNNEDSTMYVIDKHAKAVEEIYLKKSSTPLPVGQGNQEQGQ